MAKDADGRLIHHNLYGAKITHRNDIEVLHEAGAYLFATTVKEMLAHYLKNGGDAKKVEGESLILLKADKASVDMGPRYEAHYYQVLARVR